MNGMSLNELGAADHRGFEHRYEGKVCFDEMYCLYRRCKHKMKEHDGKICKCKHKQTSYDVGFLPSVVIFYKDDKK